MRETPNLLLKLPDPTDYVSIEDINGNMETIDTEINKLLTDNVNSVKYAADSGTANAKVVTLSPTPSSYVEGMGIAFKNKVQNTGAVTVNVNGLGAKSIVKSNGNALASGNLKANSVYTIRYNGTNFILQGEGGEYGTATASDVLSGKTIGTENGVVSGTITSKAAQTFTPSTTNQTIAAGQYLSGIQTILGDADLKASNIKSGVNIFGVNGTLDVANLGGKSWASGNEMASSSTRNFVLQNGSSAVAYYIVINTASLGFVPSFIYVHQTDLNNKSVAVWSYSDLYRNTAGTEYGNASRGNDTWYRVPYNASALYLPLAIADTSVNWYAFS